jgi:hypothetical protein
MSIFIVYCKIIENLLQLSEETFLFLYYIFFQRLYAYFIVLVIKANFNVNAYIDVNT